MNTSASWGSVTRPLVEYEILKNALIVRRAKHGKYERVVEIFAEMREAQLLLALAHKICPVAVPAIVKAISVAHV
jgi:pentatricopeptide repeat protein